MHQQRARITPELPANVSLPQFTKDAVYGALISQYKEKPGGKHEYPGYTCCGLQLSMKLSLDTCITTVILCHTN